MAIGFLDVPSLFLLRGFLGFFTALVLTAAFAALDLVIGDFVSLYFSIIVFISFLPTASGTFMSGYRFFNVFARAMQLALISFFEGFFAFGLCLEDSLPFLGIMGSSLVAITSEAV